MIKDLGIERIRELLPHRYPFLFVDRVLELVPGDRVLCRKNVTINEWFFDGHFPGHAVMPGVLIIEAMAQAAGIIMLSMPEHTGKLAYVAGIDNVRFRRPVYPGDSFTTEGHVTRLRGTTGKATIVARVDGDVVAECDMLFVLKARPKDGEIKPQGAARDHESNGDAPTAGQSESSARLLVSESEPPAAERFAPQEDERG